MPRDQRDEEHLKSFQTRRRAMRVFVLILLAGLILGCASKNVPDSDESLNECDRLAEMTERVYLRSRPEDVLAAATRLFQLAGGGYVVTRTEDGLKAHRVWPSVESGKDAPRDGSDTWVLVVKEVSHCLGEREYIEAVEAAHVHGTTEASCGSSVPGVKLFVYHIPEIYSQGLMPTECFSAQVHKPMVSRYTVTPALYDLFFLRMDHLLGKSSRWPSCASYSEDVRNNMHYRDQFSMLNFQGHLDGLCVQVEDRRP
jgi:hypothetical protein